MAIKTRKISDWLSQNGEAITAASKASMLKSVNDGIDRLNDGVFVVCVEKRLYKIKKVEDYKMVKSTVTALGVLVSESNKQCIVALHGTNIQYSDGTYPNKHPNFIGNRQSAIQDFDVINKNRTILEGLSTLTDEQKAKYAVGYCSLYSVIDRDSGTGIKAGEWFMPTFGYAMFIYNNLNKVNYALSQIDGAELISAVPPSVWHTCTEMSPAKNYFIDFNDGTSNGWQDTIESHIVRPIAFISNNL